jgi:hypothetical protein
VLHFNFMVIVCAVLVGASVMTAYKGSLDPKHDMLTSDRRHQQNVKTNPKQDLEGGGGSAASFGVSRDDSPFTKGGADQTWVRFASLCV